MGVGDGLGFPDRAPVSRAPDDEDASVDLFEYQARDLFAAHGVPVLRRRTSPTTPDEARAAAEQLGGGHGRRQGAGQDRRPRQGGRRQARPQPAGGGRARGRDPRHGHQGPHRAPGDGHRRARTSPRSTTSRSCSTAPTAPTSRWRRRRAAWRSSSSRSSGPRRWRGSPVDALDRRRRREGRARSSRPAGFPDDVADQVADVLAKLWQVFTAEDATLVEVNPLVTTADGRVVALDGKVTLDENADVPAPRPRGARRQRRGGPARGSRPRRRTSTTSSSTARSASSATARGW